MSAPKSATRNGSGWPGTGPGATTPVFPGPITTEEAEQITSEGTAPATEHLGPADQPGNAAISVVRPGTDEAPISLIDGMTPGSKDIDVLARFLDLVAQADGLRVRDVKPTRMAVNVITLQAANGSGAVRLLSREPGRWWARIRTTPNDGSAPVVKIGTDPDCWNSGYTLFSTESIELHHRDEVWIAASPVNTGSVNVEVIREILV